MKERKARKGGRYVVPVSFLETEKDLVKYVDDKGWGFSTYIKYLIRQDMAGITPQGVPANMNSNIQTGAEAVGMEQATPQKKTDKDAVNNLLDMD